MFGLACKCLAPLGAKVTAFFGALIETTATVIGPDAWSSILDALTAQISVTTVVGVIASVIGAGIGLVFMWWGVRKLIHVIMSAFKKGRLSV